VQDACSEKPIFCEGGGLTSPQRTSFWTADGGRGMKGRGKSFCSGGRPFPLDKKKKKGKSATIKLFVTGQKGEQSGLGGRKEKKECGRGRERANSNGASSTPREAAP